MWEGLWEMFQGGVQSQAFISKKAWHCDKSNKRVRTGYAYQYLYWTHSNDKSSSGWSTNRSQDFRMRPWQNPELRIILYQNQTRARNRHWARKTQLLAVTEYSSHEGHLDLAIGTATEHLQKSGRVSEESEEHEQLTTACSEDTRKGHLKLS